MFHVKEVVADVTHNAPKNKTAKEINNLREIYCEEITKLFLPSAAAQQEKQFLRANRFPNSCENLINLSISVGKILNKYPSAGHLFIRRRRRLTVNKIPPGN